LGCFYCRQRAIGEIFPVAKPISGARISPAKISWPGISRTFSGGRILPRSPLVLRIGYRPRSPLFCAAIEICSALLKAVCVYTLAQFVYFLCACANFDAHDPAGRFHLFEHCFI
jgi:hypothetical protein